jgi:hypothetical protein
MANRKVGNQLPGVILAAAVIAGVAFFIHRESARDDAQHDREQEGQRAARTNVLEAGDLAEMLSLCREGWEAQAQLRHDPVAIAWTRRGVDAYFFDGTDSSSVRQVRCDAEGVSRGPRVFHPLAAHVPAEAAPERDERAQGEWPAAIAHFASQHSFEAEDLAFELVLHPATGVPLSRRWRGGPERASAVVEPVDAPEFAFLPASAGFEPFPASAAPPLRPLPRHHWLADAASAFALLSRELPKGARVSELALEDDKLDVQIEFPTPAFEGKPPAPYGDKAFDEYGIADTGWWYPREVPGFGCPTGSSLEAVQAAFVEARARLGSQPLSRAWYSCSPAYSNGRDGVWHLVAR